MNRLANETSLYLRQHAQNPVDWFPWGPEALARSRELDRPIFLSIGYSACHWCHVMEHESFEDPATAEVLNADFICIKVDREERPDLDNIYMTALQVMTREGGGWPLSVWLTPELRPFYAGTYFPPDNRYAPQRPSFRTVLAAIAEAWANRRAEIRDKSEEIVQFLNDMDRGGPAGELSPTLLRNLVEALKRGFDATAGGFGRAPKFPHALEIALLLRIAFRFDNKEALHMATFSLDKMAAGGICDQIGGGFHRYSTDAQWLVPHFEKMLYDNALLTRAFTDAFLLTKNSQHRDVAMATLDYVLREMTSSTGAFYCTQDADSEGEEGKFYVWSKAEIESLLDPAEAETLNYVYGVSDGGNFEGHNILNRPKSWEQVARMLKKPEGEIRAVVAAAGSKLYTARAKRIWPGRDEKILTAWNGLMIAAFARAGAAFGEPRYVAAASAAADYLLKSMRSSAGLLFRSGSDTGAARIDGYSEDYACLIDALIELHQATFEVRWLEAAVGLAETLLARFGDPAGGFFFAPENSSELIVRNKDSYDGSTPSGNGMAATALLRLGVLTDRRDFVAAAEKTLLSFAAFMRESPGGAGQMLTAYDFLLGPVREVVLVGTRGSAEVDEVLKLLRANFAPNCLLVFRDPADGPTPKLLKHLLDGRDSAGGSIALYICENYSCRAPLVGLEAIQAGLAHSSSSTSTSTSSST